MRALQAAGTAIALSAFAVLSSPAGAAPKAPLQTLVDQLGRPFRMEALHGAPAVVTFVAARCTDACPLIDAQMAAAANDARARGVRFVTITLDPEHDTPAVMRALARRFDARPPRSLFVSGSATRIRTLMRRFGVAAQQGAGGTQEMHTAFVYVLDARGHLAQRLLASSNLPDELFGAIAR